MKQRLNDAGNVDMITAAIVAAVMLAISVPIVFSTISGLDIGEVDRNLADALGRNSTVYTPAANATGNLINNVQTFYTIAPVYILVVAAVGIIMAVLYLRGRPS